MADTNRRQSKVWVGVGIAVVAVGALIFARTYFHERVGVRVTRPSHADMVSTVSTNGKVEPIEDFQAHAPGPGVVKKVYVSVGEHVDRGAPLLRMDDSEARKNIATAAAAVNAAQATLRNMQAGGTQEERLGAAGDLTMARMQQKQAAAGLAAAQALAAKGSASSNEVAAARQKVDDATAKLAQLEARKQGRYGSSDLAVQQAQVAQAQAALRAAQDAYTGVDIHAPFAGTVYSVPVSDYDFVQFGEALLNLADLNHIRVRAYFDEPEIGKLAAGQPVKIVWDARPNAAWHGHIEQAPTTVIPYGTRSVGECIITVDDAKGELLPNTNVTVTVTTAQKFGVLSIPREGLHTDGTRNFVYKIVDGRLVRTPVGVGSVNNTRVEITGGISDTDEIALSGESNVDLKDKLQVKALP